MPGSTRGSSVLSSCGMQGSVELAGPGRDLLLIVACAEAEVPILSAMCFKTQLSTLTILNHASTMLQVIELQGME